MTGNAESREKCFSFNITITIIVVNVCYVISLFQLSILLGVRVQFLLVGHLLRVDTT